jgi:hypothetical protein
MNYQAPDSNREAIEHLLERVVAIETLTSALKELESVGIDLGETEKYRSALEDLAAEILLGFKPVPPSEQAEQGQWVGAIERAKQLGYTLDLNQLGHTEFVQHIASLGLSSKKEGRKKKRKYLVNDKLDEAISDFFCY